MKLSIAASVATVLALTSLTQAAVLVSFDPLPVTTGVPEVVFGGSPKVLDDAAGFAGSGVGGSAGVQLQTPLAVTSVSGFESLSNGGTRFTDVSMGLSGFQAIVAAQTFLGLIGQGLGDGTFKFTSSAASGAMDLLSGSVTGFGIVAIGGSDTGSILSANVTYTSGAIYDALIAIPGATLTGSLSWTLLDSTPAFAIDGDTFLNAFSANVNGQFSTPVIPEPSALGLLAPAGLLLARRRR